jgi:hypothetical protein
MIKELIRIKAVVALGNRSAIIVLASRNLLHFDDWLWPKTSLRPVTKSNL